MLKFTKNNIQEQKALGMFDKYFKTVPVEAMRVHSEFETETLEGVLVCKDGYLALDSQGNPYPIDKEIFKETYKMLPTSGEIHLTYKTV